VRLRAAPNPPPQKKQLRPVVREMMGDVMLLGAGMRPPASVNSMLQCGDLVTAAGAALENVQGSDPTSEDVTAHAAGDASCPHDLAPTSFVDHFPQASPPELLNACDDSSTQQAPQTPTLSAHAPESATVSQAPAPDKALDACGQEQALVAQVSSREVALQTDFLPSGCVAQVGFAGRLSASEAEERILCLQRCDPRQVNFTSWVAIPKPERALSPEARYLTHVRSRFPGTIKGGCRLADKNEGKQRVTRHLKGLMIELATEEHRLMSASPGAKW